MKKSVRNFLNSGLNEVEYYFPDQEYLFLLDKDKLLTLREYLAFLKSKEDEFKESVQEDVKSIQDKCDWVESIRFDGLQLFEDEPFEYSTIIVSGSDFNIAMYYNETLDEFLPKPLIPPRFLCLTDRSKKKRDIVEGLSKVEYELDRIDIIGQQVFNGLLFNESISEEFELCYQPFKGVFLYHNQSTLAFFDHNSQENSASKTGICPYLLDEEQQEKVLSRIIVRK